MKFLKLSTFAILALFFVFVACDKDDPVVEETYDAETEATANAAVATSEFVAVAFVGEEVVPSVGKKGVADYSFGACASVNHTVLTKTITIDFGTAGCTGLDGRTRKGSITIVYDGIFRNPGSTFVVTASNYEVDGIVINGTITVGPYTTNGTNLDFGIAVSNGSIVYADGSQATTTFTNTYSYHTDTSEFYVTGSSSTTFADGSSLSSTITSDLIWKTSCTAAGNPFPSTGVQAIVKSGSPTMVLDWGTGTCDYKASLTVGRVTREIDFQNL